MSAHVLLILLNELGKRDKMRGLPSILSLFRNEFNKFNNGHRPVNVKRALIGSKGGWKLSTIFLSCKVFHDWSIIKLGNILYLLDGYIFAVLFETTSHCFC